MNVPNELREDFERYCLGCEGLVPMPGSADWNRLASAFMAYRTSKFHPTFNVQGTKTMRRQSFDLDQFPRCQRSGFSNIEKRIERMHRWTGIAAVIGLIMSLVFIGGGFYVVYLLLAHFGVI